MKNISIKTLIVCLTLMAGFTSVLAQESNTLQFMKGMPQFNLQNPALHNDSSKVVIGLPGLSGLYVEGNSGFAMRDLIHKGTGVLADSLVLDIEGFHNQLRKTNTIELNASLPLFYLGLRIKKSFFSLGITEKQTGQLTFAKSFVTFIKDGNGPYMGKDFNLGDLDMDAMHYREFALGYSNEVIANKLTAGIKAKILYGKSALQTIRMNPRVETAADGSSLDLKADMQLNLSAPMTPEFDPQGLYDGMNSDDADPVDYMLQNGNTGLAFDLGAVYKLTPKITLSGSIIDLGRISFKKDVTTLKYSYSHPWTGIDISNSIDQSQEDYVAPGDVFEEELENIEEDFKAKKSNFGTKSFAVNLPVKVYVGGTYDLNKKVNVGFLERFYKHGDFIQNSMTLSANTMVSNFLSLTGSYSVIGHSMSNLGFGMAIRAGALQFYAVGDNLLALSPARAQYVNARLGMNLLFGRIHKAKGVE